MHDEGYRLLGARIGCQLGFRPTVLQRRLAQRPGHAIRHRFDELRELPEIGCDLLELAAEMRLPPTGIVSGLIDRSRRRLALLRRQPEQLASVGDVVLDEPVKPLVKDQALLQGADLLGECFLVEVRIARWCIGAVHSSLSRRDGRARSAPAIDAGPSLTKGESSLPYPPPISLVPVPVR